MKSPSCDKPPVPTVSVTSAYLCCYFKQDTSTPIIYFTLFYTIIELVHHLQVTDVEAGATTDLYSEEIPKKKKSRLCHWFSHDGIGGWVIQSIRSAALKGVKYFIKTNFVLTLISMMVG